MADTQQKPAYNDVEGQAQYTAAQAEIAIAAVVADSLAVSAYASQIAASGYTIDAISNALFSLFRPLIVARITLIGEAIQTGWDNSLPTDGPSRDIWDEILATEVKYELKFVKRSAARLTRHMIRAASNGDDLKESLATGLKRELRFQRMRQAAVIRRVTLRLDEDRVQGLSPQGAYWVLNPTAKIHTPDCLAMAGKAWTWRVLSIIRPSNRHNLCGCRLIPLGAAISHSLPGAFTINNNVPSQAREH